MERKKKIRITDNDYCARSEAQKKFLYADLENINEVLLTGPGGTGKTVSLLISSIGPQKDGTLLINNPEYVGVIVRREATQLEKSGLINAAKEWFKKFDPIVDYNASLRKFTFSSGAQIWLRGCETEEDALKFKGYTRLHFVGFEELTQLTETQFDLISTRLRDANSKIPLRVRSTTNAGDTGEEWVMNRYKYWLYKDSVDKLDPEIELEYGENLYSYIDEDSIDLNRVISKKKPSVRNFETITCIATKANDIMKNNIQTLGKINDPILRMQLLEHKWGLRAGAGSFFNEIDFKLIDNPPKIATRCRYWDKACSGKRGDFLCGVLLSRTTEDTYIIEDCILSKPEVHEIENIILTTCLRDKLKYGNSYYVGIEQEGGSSGKEISLKYENLLRKNGIKLIIDIKKASKIERATMLSTIVKEGRFGILSGGLPWKNEFFKQLTNFPNKNIHDDAPDSCAGSYFLLSTKIPAPLSQYNEMNMIMQLQNALPDNLYGR